MLGYGLPRACSASTCDHQQGNSSSQAPIGRSKRASFRYGFQAAGAARSTQLPRGASGSASLAGVRGGFGPAIMRAQATPGARAGKGGAGKVSMWSRYDRPRRARTVRWRSKEISAESIGLLQLHAPIAQIGQHDGLARHGAAHEVARTEDLKLTVEIAQLRLALEAEQLFEPIHSLSTSTPNARSDKPAQHTIGLPAAPV